ncbi:glycosyltransferase family 4 protein [Thermofilum sp.]|uniref:glycosyltransferase family 4 protein n=1 Tax=Thermofilum sp. TaxID=1961369 RepID=UPI0031632AF2
MRIVHVAPFYYPVIGGVEEVVKRVAEYMASKGNEVYVLTYNRLRVDGKGSLPREETIKDVHVVRLKPNITWSHGTYSTELPEVLKKLKPDVVHVHVWRHPHVFQVAKLKERMSFKAILHSHAPFHRFSQLAMVTWLYHKTVDWFMKGTLKKYDVIIALTPYEKTILVQKLGAQEEKVVITPNGIDDRLVNSAQNMIRTEPVVLYLGRISRSKNVDLLVKAMRYVKKEVASARLVMAGPDEGLALKLRRYAQRYDVNFQYLGIVSSESEKGKLYSECSVFAHPALYEPFGITLLEAQAFGKPCVITGEGGQLYAAPPGRTSLHARSNPRDFGEAISLLLKDRRLYEKLSANAREWAFRHSWSKILPRYDEVYNKLCA